MRKLLLRITVYVSIIVVITLAVNICYLCVDPEYHSMNVPENIQICNFGSSHGKCGFDYEDFKGKYVCSNFGLTSQSLFYDYSILQTYQDKLQPGAVVFIVASYFSFFGHPEAEEKEFLAKNKRYYRFLPSKLIMQYDWKTDLYINYLPCLSPTGLLVLVKHVFGIDRDASMFEDFNMKGIAREANSRDAELQAQKLCSRHIGHSFDDAGRRLRRQESFEAIYGMIELCKQIGARPILVTVPYLREYTDAIRKNDPEFFPDFYAAIDEVRQKTGIEYYDYAFDKRFCGEYELFLNPDHLNIKGAKKFTNILLHEVLGIEPD